MLIKGENDKEINQNNQSSDPVCSRVPLPSDKSRRIVKNTFQCETSTLVERKFHSLENEVQEIKEHTIVLTNEDYIRYDILFKVACSIGGIIFGLLLNISQLREDSLINANKALKVLDIGYQIEKNVIDSLIGTKKFGDIKQFEIETVESILSKFDDSDYGIRQKYALLFGYYIQITGELLIFAMDILRGSEGQELSDVLDDMNEVNSYLGFYLSNMKIPVYVYEQFKPFPDVRQWFDNNNESLVKGNISGYMLGVLNTYNLKVFSIFNKYK